MTIRKAIALFVVLAILVAGGLYLIRTEQLDNERMRNLYTEAEPLEREREALQAELNSLDADYSLRMRDYGTVEILFTDLSAQIYTEAYPIMRERGVVGTIGLNYRLFPGTGYNKLSAANINSLVSDGWGVCLIYDGSWTNGFQAWFTQFSNALSASSIPVPTSIYFTNDIYDQSMDADLTACGITTVVTNALNGQTGTVSSPSRDIWLTVAMPWTYTGVATDTELIGRTDGSNLCFLMSFSEVWDKTKNKNVESEEKASFTAILDSWQDMLYTSSPLDDLEQLGPTPYIYLDTSDKDTMNEMYLDSLTPEQQLLLPKFRSANFDSAHSFHLDTAEANETLSQERESRRAELTNQIAALDAKISEIYERWGQSSQAKG
ncbi:MAG: hypothetical protein IJQ02_01445 [Oscillospiraceae bacterium]|nr:hypothetical protein [Oscillospiraceae bacterium]